MPLTDAAIRNAKPQARGYKLFDGGGLHLYIAPGGGKLWRLKYRFQNKERLLSLGAYPAIGLKDARIRRDEAKALLARGGDPGLQKKKAAAAAAISLETTFAAVAEEFVAKREREGVGEVTAAKSRWLLSLIAEDIGARPIADIEAYELLAAMKRIEASGRLETGRRLLSLCSRVFRYAVATARTRHNVAADLKGALTAPKAKHHAALLEPTEVGALMRAIASYGGQPSTYWALQLAPHVFVRPGELRQAEWREFDLEGAVWRIPASRMKMRREHAVPLSLQAVAILQKAQFVSGGGRLAFPSMGSADRPISENTLNGALRRLGYSSDQMTSHGFRATASTLLNESGMWSADAIERALAHGQSDGVRAAYHRGAHWDERVRMAQWWSDYLGSITASEIDTLIARLPTALS